MSASLTAPGPDLAWRDGELAYCGVSAAQLAERCGTPSFVYSRSRLEGNLERLRSALTPPAPWRLRVAYSVKTAWEPRLLDLVRSAGAGAEVACAHELELALARGFARSDILVDGPAHDRELIERAAAAGVHALKIDSLDQLRLVGNAAPESGLDVSLRLSAPPRGWLSGPAEAMEGRFGLRGREVDEALRVLSLGGRLRLRGFAVHVGSQVGDPRRFGSAVRSLAEACDLAERRGLAPGEINIGGGFPSPTLGATSPGALLRGTLTDGRKALPPISRYAGAILREIGLCRFPSSVNELVVEPGRSLTSDAAILLTRVVAAKGRWLVLDASRSFVPESPLFARRRFVAVQRNPGERLRRASLAGCTLSGGDVLALGVRLPQARAGDLLVMMDAGAYTLSRANRFMTVIPAVYLLDDDGKVAVLRRRETSEDVVREAQEW